MEKEVKCPDCQSVMVIKFGKRWSGSGKNRKLIQKYQCNSCGRKFADNE